MSAAAFQATYSDFKLIRSRKCVQIVLEVPLEKSNEALTALGGMPDPAEEKWCAIAMLDLKAIKQSVGDAGHVASAGNGKDKAPSPTVSRHPVALDKKLAQRAGIMCSDPAFHRYLAEVGKLSDVNEEEAAAYVRTLCGVQSRSEIRPGTPAADKFSFLLSSYTLWAESDRYVEAS
jgi:hypothetical protein